MTMNTRFVRDLAARDPWAMFRLISHLPNLVRLYWRLLRDPRVSLPAKAVLLAGVAYVISPLQVLQDFLLLPVGWLESAIVLVFAGQMFIRLCPPRVVEEHVRLIDGGA
jgi:uncharacterized membrane protein YkvA (DUF1232 family)